MEDSPQARKIAELFQSAVEYKAKLEKQGKIVSGGPCLDILGEAYILQVKSVEEMGEIFFNDPVNLWTDREVHPLGTYQDTLEGMKEMTASTRSRKR